MSIPTLLSKVAYSIIPQAAEDLYNWITSSSEEPTKKYIKLTKAQDTEFRKGYFTFKTTGTYKGCTTKKELFNYFNQKWGINKNIGSYYQLVLKIDKET